MSEDGHRETEHQGTQHIIMQNPRETSHRQQREHQEEPE